MFLLKHIYMIKLYQMGGCIGFLKTLRRIVNEQAPSSIYIAWEGGGSKGTGAKVPFGDDAFQQTTGNLNGSGGKNTSLTTPVFISPSFNRYKSANFNDLSLGPWSWA